MKVSAILAETGQKVEAKKDVHWDFIRTEPRPKLFCPTSVIADPTSCRVQLVSVENANGTRFFKKSAGQPSCDHEETEQPAAPERDTASLGESPEHKWLKDFVADIARRSGYQADLEKSDPDTPGRTADVLVRGARRPRVEIQRVDTDVAARTADNPNNVMWLMRAADQNHANHTRWLFGYPCVRVLIHRHMPDGSTCPGYPWLDDDERNHYTAYASSTVLEPHGAPKQTMRDRWVGNGRQRRKVEMPYDDYFTGRGTKMPLDQFLREVWSGERVWRRRWAPHQTAGWILQKDLDAFDQWKIRQRQQQAEAVIRRLDALANHDSDSATPLTSTAANGDPDLIAAPNAPVEREPRAEPLLPPAEVTPYPRPPRPGRHGRTRWARFVAWLRG